MVALEGVTLKGKLTKDLYKVKKILDEIVMLENENGSTRIWIGKKNLGSFYKKIKGDNVR
ncbi:MAG: hypothetical protein ABII96_04290 [Candidatus Zixiibacteriota bacterium]